MLIMIDPGHGGDDPGRVGQHKRILNESDVNWSVAIAVAALLRRDGCNILFTRQQNETMAAGARARLANELPKDDSLFISLHCNGHWEASPKGFEVWHFPGSLRGERLARMVLESMENLIPRPSRGLKPQSDEDHHKVKKLSVLAQTKMPAILVEMEFLSNRDGQRFLSRGVGQVRLADAIAKGVMRWVKEVGSCSDRASSGRR